MVRHEQATHMFLRYDEDKQDMTKVYITPQEITQEQVWDTSRVSNHIKQTRQVSSIQGYQTILTKQDKYHLARVSNHINQTR